MKTDALTTRKTILSVVEVVRLEIEGKRKKLFVSDEKLVQMIMDKIAAADKDFATEKEQISFWGAVAREVCHAG